MHPHPNFLTKMITFPSVSHCLRRFFTLFNGFSGKNRHFTNICFLNKSSKLTKRNFPITYKVAQTRCIFSTKDKGTLHERNLEEDESEKEDKLLLCDDDGNDDDDDGDDEEVGTLIDDTETSKISGDNNNYKNYETANLKTNREKETGPIIFKKNKKFKYDSDITIVYADICDVPANLFSIPPTEEEIEHVNSGGAEYNYGNYSSKVAFITNRSKNNKGSNDNRSAKS